MKKVAKSKAPAPRRKPSSRRKPQKGSIRRGLLQLLLFPFRFAWRIGWRIAFTVVLLVGLSVLYYASTLPQAMDLVDGRAKGSVTLLDQDGKVFAWRGEQFGGTVTAETVSPYLKNAVIATEDKRYYWHFGIDFYGTSAAMWRNYRANGNPFAGHGGSSITQQTAKLLCFGVPFDPKGTQTEAEYEAECRKVTLWRKIKEATYALAMEAKYTKSEILTIYLNRAFLGAGARGFEAAAQRYFGISATEVDASEAAMLAGLLKAPSRFAPTNNLSRAQNRAAVVVGLMEEQGYLTGGEAEFARLKPAELSRAAAAKAGGYFADWVMASGPNYFTRNTTEDVIIRTTLDPAIQQAAENAVARIFEERVKEGSKAQAAVVVMSADGAVRAMVGGRSSKVVGAFNRATQAKRQTGSVFKPFVFATALELGFSPNDTVVDEPVTYQIPGSGAWSPTNYTDDFKGRMTLTEALVRSTNIPAIKISEAAGRDLVRKVAQDFGITSELARGPAVALGVSESTLIEMTGAYAGILNGGSSVTPYGLVDLKFQGDAEPLVGRAGGIGERVVGENAAHTLIGMMQQVVERGTGRKAQLPGVEVAGKTGTTQASRDAWFIGFTADYVAGVWMGYDDNSPLSGVTGSGLPAEIWNATMQPIYLSQPARPLPRGAATTQTQTPNQIPTPPPTAEENTIVNVLIDLLSGNGN